jgi:nicotinamide-nucleotide adenylyltransferase
MATEDAVTRQARALALLHDPATQAHITAEVAALDAATGPAVRIIAGAAGLAGVQRLGLLAGSFNPPTQAHVALAQSARAHGQVDAVLWSISRVTVDKEHVARAPLPDRLIALSALVATQPPDAVALCNRGLYAEQAQAVRDTLPHLRDLAIITGYDKIVQIFDPHYYTDRQAALDELFGLARVLVAPRGDDGEADLAALLQQPANRPCADRVQFLPLAREWRALSSTAARTRIAAQQSIADLVPPEALALVEYGAYR